MEDSGDSQLHSLNPIDYCLEMHSAHTSRLDNSTICKVNGNNKLGVVPEPMSVRRHVGSSPSVSNPVRTNVYLERTSGVRGIMMMESSTSCKFRGAGMDVRLRSGNRRCENWRVRC